MKRWFNVLIQILGVSASSSVPEFTKDPIIASAIIGVITATQGLVGVLAHKYNPDGTKAEAPYLHK